jgi:hypothetical protein
MSTSPTRLAKITLAVVEVAAGAEPLASIATTVADAAPVALVEVVGSGAGTWAATKPAVATGGVVSEALTTACAAFEAAPESGPVAACAPLALVAGVFAGSSALASLATNWPAIDGASRLVAWEAWVCADPLASIATAAVDSAAVAVD